MSATSASRDYSQSGSDPLARHPFYSLAWSCPPSLLAPSLLSVVHFLRPPTRPFDPHPPQLSTSYFFSSIPHPSSSLSYQPTQASESIHNHRCTIHYSCYNLIIATFLRFSSTLNRRLSPSLTLTRCLGSCTASKKRPHFVYIYSPAPPLSSCVLRPALLKHNKLSKNKNPPQPTRTMSFAYHFQHHPSTATGSRSRRNPHRPSSTKSFQMMRPKEELTDSPTVPTFIEKFEAGRSFEMEDDFAFIPELCTEEEVRDTLFSELLYTTERVCLFQYLYSAK